MLPDVPAVSVLDQALAREGQAPGAPLRAAVELARAVDHLGFTRFLLAEHHALGSTRLAAPEVVVGQVAAATRHLRVGSGGMLLPNHTPLHVAEQFRALEALHPGRIDLGIGRSEGSLDPTILTALGRRADNAHGEGFDEQLDHLLAFGGVRPLPDDHPLAGVRATPQDVPLPPIILLGSSASSARTAARRGLAYGFASYSNPDGMTDAIQAYKRQFVPARPGDAPRALLAVRVMVGEDDEHARALSLPGRLSWARTRATGVNAMPRLEDALRHVWTEEELAAAAKIDSRADAIGDAAHVRAHLEALAAETGADEIVALCITDPDERIAAYERLAAAMDLPRPAGYATAASASATASR
jgi:luciferase family oxidoreductase group 1